MAIKALIVGDAHLQVQKLPDGRKFVDRMVEHTHQHELTILLGDLLHTFAVIRSEVLSLWNDYFERTKDREVVAIVGNHDFAGQSGGSHALECFKSRVKVVDQPASFWGAYFMPFYRDNAAFEAEARQIPAGSVLFCHQSFAGCRFGNGFLDPHGVALDSVSHLGAVVSGHIHARQSIGNVWYPGTPFQHDFSEAGQDKFVTTVLLSAQGYSVVKDHDLGLPRFEVIQAMPGEPLVEGLLKALPEPVATTSYKIVGRGTPAEIGEFWKTPEAKRLRAGARRVVDGILPDKGEIDLPGSKGKNRQQKLEGFIRGRKWRTDTERLCDAARDLVAGQPTVL